MEKLSTSFTEMMNCEYPIIAAPMFLVSNVDMTVETSEFGGVGAFPALNYRPIEEYAKALKEIRERTTKPIAVNVIVNKSNIRRDDDLKIALDAGVDLFITSLGSPKDVIKEAHKNGAKVVCDVTNLEHALKVQDLGADGVIAVGSGAGGHAGPISPVVLIPWLARELNIPVIAAGGISDGRTMAAMMALGASAVSVGTRFIVSKEARVDKGYKDAILKSSPEDIMMTRRISGTPVSVIKTPYTEKLGSEMPFWIDIFQKNRFTKKYASMAVHFSGLRKLQDAAEKPTFKTVWSAGQGVGLIDEELSCKGILQEFVKEYRETLSGMPS